MIIKGTDPTRSSTDPRFRAGDEAERRTAFYLHRAFSAEPRLLVLNDLRLVDPEQPDPDGRPGVCQIDHLLIHRWGAFIVESKSVTDEVAVRHDGCGGDEWTRRFKGRDQGFPSPIQQAHRQGEFLRTFLQRHRQELLGRVPMGLRTITKLVAGSDQRGFRHMPIQIVVAISDSGKIRRVNGWTEPSEPFQTFVSKADLVPGKISEQFAKHKADGRLLADSKGDYGVWVMQETEVAAVASFLVSKHEPGGRAELQVPSERVPAPPSASTVPAKAAIKQSPPVCKGCGGSNLTAKWGQHGYHWKCDECQANTKMPTVCTECGAQGHRGKPVRIRKDGPSYLRVCDKCGDQRLIWTQEKPD